MVALDVGNHLSQHVDDADAFHFFGFDGQQALCGIGIDFGIDRRLFVDSIEGAYEPVVARNAFCFAIVVNLGFKPNGVGDMVENVELALSARGCECGVGL